MCTLNSALKPADSYDWFKLQKMSWDNILPGLKNALFFSKSTLGVNSKWTPWVNGFSWSLLRCKSGSDQYCSLYKLRLPKSLSNYQHWCLDRKVMLNSTWLAYLNLCACQVQSLAFFQHPIISKKKMCLLNQENWKVLHRFAVYYPYSKVILNELSHKCLVWWIL